MDRLFGTDGIRGVANKYPITPEMGLKIGKALACLFRRKGRNSRFVIGRDTRISGYMLEEALTAGICSMGGDVHALGVLPTPAVAYTVRKEKAHAGIVISASHNPFEDNGIKLFSEKGFKFSLEREKELEGFIFGEKYKFIEGDYPGPDELGRPFRSKDGAGPYIDFLKGTFPDDLSMKGIKAVLDCANGAAFMAAPAVFKGLGAEVDAINTRPNGININSDCGSQYPEKLAQRVLKKGASLGMAFDGDGDRMIAVDEKGNVIPGDKILLICSRTLKKEGRLKGNAVVTTVMSNLGLGIALKEAGIRHIMSDVGDQNVLKDMLDRDLIIGGEDSGHIIFLEHHTTGDGILSGLQLISCMLKEKRPLSVLGSTMDIYPQKLINVNVRKKPDLYTVPEIRNTIKMVEQELGKKGRVLVRYSGTQQMCRVMVEGPAEDLTSSCCKKIAKAVKHSIG